ncbi:MAG: hypothetical protein Q9196_004763 [Gyalolechia fulgens]
MAEVDTKFPCSLLASSALRALQVDPELSPLVQRSFRLVSPSENENENDADAGNDPINMHLPNSDATAAGTDGNTPMDEKSILRTEYRAATNRMLRVSVNGFLESMGLVLGVMQELDVDVLAEAQRSV